MSTVDFPACNQDGLAPHIRVRGQGIQQLLHVPCALPRHRHAGVFAIRPGRNNPTYLRQRSHGDVVRNGLQVSAIGHGVAKPLVQRRQGLHGRCIRRGRRTRCRQPFIDGAIRGKRHQLVVIAVVAGRVVDLPGDAGGLQAFWIRHPVQAILRGAQAAPVGVGDASVAAYVRAVGPAPQEHAVRESTGVDGGVIGIADGEGVRQRPMKRQIRLLQIPHRNLGVLGTRPCHSPAIPGRLLIRPVMRAAHAQRVALGGIQVIGLHGAGRALLYPDRLARRHGDGEAVAEPTDAGHGAVVVVKRPVFLHQNNDVLNIVDRARGVVGRNGERALDGRWKRSKRGGRGGGAQEIAAVHEGHGDRYPFDR